MAWWAVQGKEINAVVEGRSIVLFTLSLRDSFAHVYLVRTAPTVLLPRPCPNHKHIHPCTARVMLGVLTVLCSCFSTLNLDVPHLSPMMATLLSQPVASQQRAVVEGRRHHCGGQKRPEKHFLSLRHTLCVFPLFFTPVCSNALPHSPLPLTPSLLSNLAHSSLTHSSLTHSSVTHSSPTHSPHRHAAPSHSCLQGHQHPTAFS